jgi:PKD repeat protein
MKKTLYSAILFLSACLFQSHLNAQILHAESFDANQFLPTGWATVGTAPDWARSTTFSAPLVGTPHSGAGMARMRNQSNSTAALTESIATPVFDLTGRGTNIVPVSFWIYRDSLVPANIDSLGVFVNTAANLTGATKIGTVARNRSVNVPDTKATNGWYQYTFNIPASFAGASNFVIFQGTVYGPTASARRIYVDDIEWTEFPPVCSGTPTGGVITASSTLFCGGSGSADLTLTGASSGTGISYQWFTSSNQSGPYIPIGSNSTAALTGTLNANQYYYNMVTCAGSALSASSDTLMITVNPNPNPVVTISMANDTICRFDTLNLTASGASTYHWSTNANPNLSTSATATDVPLNTTTYTVIGTDALGCPSQPTTQTIVVGRRPTINAFNNSNVTVCSGGSSTLTVNATSGVGGGGGGGVTLAYQWNPNVGTTNSVTVSPTTTTLYTVTVVGQFGCSTTDTTTVNVNPNAISPIISVTPDSVNFCQGTTGNTVDLTASSNVTGATYSWTASAGPPITATAAAAYTANVGNNTVTYTVTGTDPANGCYSSASATIYVRPVPNVNLVSQNTTVCLNGSAVLFTQVTNTQGTPANTYTYDWTPTATNAQVITYAPTATGYVYVTVTSPYGCSNNDSLMVTIDNTLTSPSLTLAASTNLMCSDNMSPVLLTATTDAVGASYAWTPNFINQNIDTITVNPQNSTNYSVTVTDQNGCTTASSTSVVISPAPVAGFTSTNLPTLEVSFTNSSTNATTYAWDFGDGYTSNVTNPVHGYFTSGTFTVTLIATNADGCDDTTSTTIQAQTTGLDELATSFLLYPNPTNGWLTIQNAHQTNGTIHIFSATGTNVLITSFSGSDAHVDLTDLNRGIYFVQITNDLGQMSTHRVVKQ